MAQAELSVEFVNSSAGINQFLLACIKRMALGANLYPYVLFCASCLNNLTARALDRRLMIVGVYSFFHWSLPLSFQRTEGILTQTYCKCKCFFVIPFTITFYRSSVGRNISKYGMLRSIAYSAAATTAPTIKTISGRLDGAGGAARM